MEPTHQLTEKQRYWYEHLERARRTDDSLAAYAKEQNLDVKTLYRKSRSPGDLDGFPRSKYPVLGVKPSFMRILGTAHLYCFRTFRLIC